ncbi:MAG: hypothetical protein V4463_22920 [Pseudomonadota bacterium]
MPATAADPGFKIPSASAEAAASAPAATLEVAPPAAAPVTDTSSRDAAIGSVAFVVLLLLYFFVRNAYVHHLVVKRVAPSSAGSAGWLLYSGLAFFSAAMVLALVNPGKFLTFAVCAPLVLAGLAASVAALLVGRR